MLFDPDSGLAQATVRVPAAAIPGPAELRIGTYTTAATITVSAG